MPAIANGQHEHENVMPASSGWRITLAQSSSDLGIVAPMKITATVTTCRKQSRTSYYYTQVILLCECMKAMRELRGNVPFSMMPAAPFMRPVCESKRIDIRMVAPEVLAACSAARGALSGSLSAINDRRRGQGNAGHNSTSSTTACRCSSFLCVQLTSRASVFEKTSP